MHFICTCFIPFQRGCIIFTQQFFSFFKVRSLNAGFGHHPALEYKAAFEKPEDQPKISDCLQCVWQSSREMSTILWSCCNLHHPSRLAEDHQRHLNFHPFMVKPVWHCLVLTIGFPSPASRSPVGNRKETKMPWVLQGLPQFPMKPME